MAQTYRVSICRKLCRERILYVEEGIQAEHFTFLALFPPLLTEQSLTLAESDLVLSLASVLTVSSRIFNPLRYCLFIMSTAGYTHKSKRPWYMCI